MKNISKTGILNQKFEDSTYKEFLLKLDAKYYRSQEVSIIFLKILQVLY